MKNDGLKLLCVLLTLTLLMVSVAAGAVDRCADVIPDRQELTSLRTANSETFLLKDGSYEAIVYSGAKYYLNGYGNYDSIDNTIIDTAYVKDGCTYSFTNKADEYRVYFADGDSSEILIESKGKSLKMSVQNGNVCEAVKGSELGYDERSAYTLYGNNYIMYPNLFRGADVYYAVHHEVVKEYILIDSPDSIASFSFDISFDGCKMIRDEMGNIGFIDALTGEEVFRFGNPYVTDVKGAYCAEFDYVTQPVSGSEAILSFTIPQSYLESTEREYPLLVDPSVLISGSSSTYDTYVDQSHPTENYYLLTGCLTGGQNGSNAMRTLIKFDLPSSINNKKVTRATVRIRKMDYQTPNITANRVTGSWTSGAVTWNNQPGYTTFGASGVCVAEDNNWYGMDVTAIVTSWMNGSYSNYGFLLREQYENNSGKKTKFYSSDSGYPNRPELVIRYVNSIGSRPYQQAPYDQPYVGTRTNCMGYAMEMKQNIDGAALGIVESEMYGLNTDQMLTYIAAKAQSWMTTNLGSSNYSSISAYDSDINSSSPGWYRVVLRVGFTDCITYNHVFDQGEPYDFHWWYQTSTDHGVWADKKGNLPSEIEPDSNGYDPCGSNWITLSMIYNSTGKYYQIKDLRTVSDWGQ